MKKGKFILRIVRKSIALLLLCGIVNMVVNIFFRESGCVVIRNSILQAILLTVLATYYDLKILKK